MALKSQVKMLSKEPIANTTGWRAFGLALGSGISIATPRIIEIPLVGWHYDDDEEAMVPLLGKHSELESSIVVLSNHQGELTDNHLAYICAVKEDSQHVFIILGTTLSVREIREYMMDTFMEKLVAQEVANAVGKSKIKK